MTEQEFDEAAASQRPVRLKDRSRCYWRNEWYLPRIGDDGRRFIDTHTGERHAADDGMLDALRAQHEGVRVSDLRKALAGLDGEKRIVIASEGGYVDPAPEACHEETIAVESQSDDATRGRHGHASEASGYDPTETAIVLPLS